MPATTKFSNAFRSWIRNQDMETQGGMDVYTLKMAGKKIIVKVPTETNPNDCLELMNAYGELKTEKKLKQNQTAVNALKVQNNMKAIAERIERETKQATEQLALENVKSQFKDVNLGIANIAAQQMYIPQLEYKKTTPVQPVVEEPTSTTAPVIEEVEEVKIPQKNVRDRQYFDQIDAFKRPDVVESILSTFKLSQQDLQRLFNNPQGFTPTEIGLQCDGTVYQTIVEGIVGSGELHEFAQLFDLLIDGDGNIKDLHGNTATPQTPFTIELPSCFLFSIPANRVPVEQLFKDKDGRPTIEAACINRKHMWLNPLEWAIYGDTEIVKKKPKADDVWKLVEYCRFMRVQIKGGNDIVGLYLLKATLMHSLCDTYQ